MKYQLLMSVICGVAFGLLASAVSNGLPVHPNSASYVTPHNVLLAVSKPSNLSGSFKDTRESLADVEPGAEPTAEPSAEPTAEPSAEPTKSPSVHPTMKPTAPTIRPTVSPTSPTPFVSMLVEQTVDGVSYSAYEGNQFSYDIVFVATIAQAAGTATNSVIDLMVTDSSSQSSTAKFTSTVYLRAVAKSLSVASVNLQYSIHVATGSGVTYDQLSTRLVHSVESGEFNALLHMYAVSLNVHALYAATCSTITTKDTTNSQSTNSSDSNSALPIGAVVGIVLGLCLVVTVCLWVMVRGYQRGSLEEDTRSRQASEPPKMSSGGIDRGTSAYFHTSGMSEKESINNPMRGERGALAV